jgi:hypothetical protein
MMRAEAEGVETVLVDHSQGLVDDLLPIQQNRRHQKPPRILIGWQNWIGWLVGHSDHR